MNGKRTITLGINLIGVLEKIRAKEIERGNESCSFRIAGEILAKRIINAGGLKETS